MSSVRELLSAAGSRLAAAGVPAREARLLLGRVLGLGEAQLLARDDQIVAVEPATTFRHWIDRRAAGEPVAYLLGEREFYGRTFAVDPRGLIPRPETEHLIETALALAVPAKARVLDVGVGTGAIAWTLALERPSWQVFASDLSPGALALARTNAHRLGVPPRLSAGDLGAAWRLSTFDLVVSNPPYVEPAGAFGVPRELRHEPALALFADDHPAGPAVSVYARLLRDLGAPDGLRPGTPVVVEIGFNQAEAVTRLAVENGFERVALVRDYADLPRTMVLKRR